MNEEIKMFLYFKYKNIVEEKDDVGFTVALYDVDEYDTINFPGLFINQLPSSIKLSSKILSLTGKNEWAYFIGDDFYYTSDALKRIKLLAFL